mmetsp:Transcript_7389/g.9168  ORF Transcript_7389/g.9168 Transcript_7389/m.9168 type:complete len:208 (+) Transcript_7389:98-721(+)
MFKTTLFLLALFMPAALVQSFKCEDSSYFDFVILQNSQLVTYRCADLMIEKNKRLCSETIGDTLVSDKCPNACGTCPSADSGSCSTRYPTWVDSRGKSCAWYAQRPSVRCARADEFLNNFLTASIVCCECGGGCINFPQGWHDADGPEYNCAWYEKSDRCEEDGGKFRSMGFVANEACCTCGGGFEQSGTAISLEDSEDEDKEIASA